MESGGGAAAEGGQQETWRETLGDHHQGAGGEEEDEESLSLMSVFKPFVSLSPVSLSTCLSICLCQTGRTAFLCLQTYQRFASDSLRRSNWTPAEDALLRELVDKMRIGNFIPYTQSTDLTVTSL